MDRPRHAREHLLGLGAAAGAIAAADLASDHRGPDGLLGAPVRRVDRRVPEEGEDSGEFDGQVGGESFGFLQCRWVVDQTTEPDEPSTAGSCKTMVAQMSGIAMVAQLKSVLQDGLYPGRPPAAWMIGSQVPSAAKEVSQTGLVQRAGEAPIRRPTRRAPGRRRSRGRVRWRPRRSRGCSASTTLASRVASFENATGLPQKDRTRSFRFGARIQGP